MDDDLAGKVNCIATKDLSRFGNDRICLLRDQNLFSEHQARRHFARADGGWRTVYVQRTEGDTNGFNQWMKQVTAICLTTFMQTTLLFLGLLTFPGNMLLGLGIMLAANEVPRIAQQCGLQTGNHRMHKGFSTSAACIKEL